jgi:hypothetical protein
MNIFKLLSKQETKEMEQTSTPIENLIFKYQLNGTNTFKYLMAATSWTHANNIDYRKETQKSLMRKLSDLLGHRPQYNVKLEFNFAVWGLRFKNQKFLIYCAKGKGLCIQVEPEASSKFIEEFVDTLSQKLKSKNWYLQKVNKQKTPELEI